MKELASYLDGHLRVVVSHDGDGLVFSTRCDTDEPVTVAASRMPVADFIAKGAGPWPWFDLNHKRDAMIRVLDALGVDRPAWTEPLPAEILDLFERAHRGDSSVIELLAMGFDPDPLDPCGASPLWYGVRSLSAGIVVALIDAGADAGRRIELSARGERFTTILHEIVRAGRTVALNHALAQGVDPSLVDSDGATPMHVIDGADDQVNAEIVRTLARAGASVNTPTPGGTQPIERAAQQMLPATVAALIELGAEAGRGLDALMSSWGVHRAGCCARDVVDVIDALRCGGATVTQRHRELASAAGAAQIEAALRA
ncbi:ankyrin repeat domain-containing protein [Mycolicibacterium pulveris]|uniref:ankyrin repeat domain-containing protein n=1 Tax=Mycolicibacterium pulveris TaxID=36813 RepID=UPI003CEE751E